MKVQVLPKRENESGWLAGLPARAGCPALEGEVRADWTIVGAGFTGLAAARTLAELRPDDTIVVLEALEVGEGASGRNSGFAIDHAHTLGGGAAEKESALAQKRLYTAGLDHLRELVHRHAIDCDWRDCGKYHVAGSGRGAEKYLKPLLEELQHTDEEHRWVTGTELESEIGIAGYEAGIFTPGTALVNPAALVRGLADNLPANVTLYEMTPVTDLIHGHPLTVRCEHGEVKTDQLILAANAYLPSFGTAARELMPFIAFASLTRVLTDAEQASLGSAPTWGLTPANAFVGPTIQKTGDGRVLFRDTITYRPVLREKPGELARQIARHRKRFAARFPALPADAIQSTWSGYLCLSANQHTWIGPAGDDIWAIGGHQGIGVTRGTICGIALAQHAGQGSCPHTKDLAHIGLPTTLPNQPWLGVGVKLRTIWESIIERGES